MSLDLHTIVEQLIAGQTRVEQLPHPLPEDVAAAVIDRLKGEADRHWWINANRSLEFAEMIIHIGTARGDLRQVALGTMARGDALKYLGCTREAWEMLEQAGKQYRDAGDEVGWARTRIGRLGICVELNRAVEALAEGDCAREVFMRRGDLEKLLRLDLNTGLVHYLIANQQQALDYYHAALSAAETLCARGQDGNGVVYTFMGVLYTNIGIVYDLLGDHRQALGYHERAREIFTRRNDTRGVALAEVNIAHIAMAQGQYRRALQLLHRARNRYVAEQLLLDAANASLDIVQCYLPLNRWAEARALAEEVAHAYHAMGAAYTEGRALLCLAMAEAELANFTAAQAALDRAEPIFTGLAAHTWVATTRLRRAQIALKQGSPALAAQEAGEAMQLFASRGQQANYATALLVYGQAGARRGDSAVAQQAAAEVLQIARRAGMPPLRYSAHLLLGQVAQAAGRLTRARRRYAAAVATIARVQHGLTITLRPGFLEDKGEALRALIGLYLDAGQSSRAFEALERARSQALLSHLANREQLRWVGDDPQSRALIAELNQLRDEYQALYRLASEAIPDERPGAPAPAPAPGELADRERRMRAITEQLYLASGEAHPLRQAAPPRLAEVQRSLDAESLLIEFYNDGVQLWAFVIDQHSLDVYPLPLAPAAVDHLIAQLQSNIAFALKAGPASSAAPGLLSVGQRILQRLAAGLLHPLSDRLPGRRRLVVVPYGSLHYLPFHLLRDRGRYLIEDYEVVILPTAGLAAHRGPVRGGGARVLAYSWGQRLHATADEAEAVRELFGGEIYFEHAARRDVLQAAPVQILHIAAHGEYRLDRPELSYIELADGQLYTDDLFQQDLSYELVTLSACDTGRANVAAGDELIGLGRGFLYAGAGALIASLWRVADGITLTLMEGIYRALYGGAGKAAALRGAQLAVLASNPRLHPAFWGAFQLIGDPRPLSRELSIVQLGGNPCQVQTVA